MKILSIEEAWGEKQGLSKALDPETIHEAVALDDHRVLRQRLSSLLDTHDDAGVPLEAFQHHVDQHGHKAVARALHDAGAVLDGRRICRHKHKEKKLRKSRLFRFRG